jgi:hypothetical protein
LDVSALWGQHELTTGQSELVDRVRARLEEVAQRDGYVDFDRIPGAVLECFEQTTMGWTPYENPFRNPNRAAARVGDLELAIAVAIEWMRYRGGRRTAP